MDRFLYLAMSGAKENHYAQAINNHNLANANTPWLSSGARGCLHRARARPGV